jgi:transcriptional regulator with XRE-family HTH domain
MWKDVRSITETIGPRIKYLRLARGLSQGDLLRKYNIPRPYISKIENGHEVPSLKSVIRIANALGVPPWLLFMTTEEFSALQNGSNKCSGLRSAKHGQRKT